MKSIRLFWCLAPFLILPMGTWATAQENAEEKPESDLDRAIGGVGEIELLQQGISTNQSLQPGGTKDFVPTVAREKNSFSDQLLTANLEDSTPLERAEWEKENWLLSRMQKLEAVETAQTENPLSNSSDASTKSSQSELWLGQRTPSRGDLGRFPAGRGLFRIAGNRSNTGQYQRCVSRG